MSSEKKQKRIVRFARDDNFRAEDKMRWVADLKFGHYIGEIPSPTLRNQGWGTRQKEEEKIEI
jgi:hypothetical protein